MLNLEYVFSSSKREKIPYSVFHLYNTFNENMDIDQREIEKGALPGILPRFYPNSISYLSELNDFRMYAEVWSNKKSKENAKRMEIGHAGYLKTLEFGERKQKRKSDKVRFDYFIVADSINYISKVGKPSAYIQMGGIQTNSFFNKIIKADRSLFKIQSLYPSSDFHSEEYLPKTFEVILEDLDLQLDKETTKYYFEIPTNSIMDSKYSQRMLLIQIFGEEAFAEKMQLLYKVGRKNIRCLFENPGIFKRNTSMSNTISRLCVAWPFLETIVFDFAGTLEYYKEVCLLGTLIKTEEETGSEEGLETPRIDGYA
ncbi:MAG: hypothetical protein ACUZ8I_09495 [Candidatus Scalindua sp.]